MLGSTAEQRDESAARRIDVAGVITVGGGLAAIVIALVQGKVWGWTSAPTVGVFAAGMGLLTQWLRGCPRLRRTARGATACAGVAATGLVSLGLTLRFFPYLLGLAERVALAGILGWAYVVSAGIRSLRKPG